MSKRFEFGLSRAFIHGIVMPTMIVPVTSSISNSAETGRPALWQIVTGFGIVYVGYGLNFLAVKIGVETLPAFLFAASHIFCAGVLLMAWQRLTQGRVLLPMAGLWRAAVGAFFLFVGGVGLVTQGEKLGVPSGVAAIIKASVPLWVALLEALRPRGERVSIMMAVGLLLGGSGVAVLVLPRLAAGGSSGSMPEGMLLLVLSALLFAIGSIFVRHRPPSDSPVEGAAWMMIFGGLLLAILGLALGEAGQIQVDDFTARTLGAFAFLLFVHSLAAFTALNWLLRHLPASVVTTKFYVSPAVALVAGSIALGEKMTLPIIASLSLILIGVGVVLWGAARTKSEPPLRAEDAEEIET